MQLTLGLAGLTILAVIAVLTVVHAGKRTRVVPPTLPNQGDDSDRVANRSESSLNRPSREVAAPSTAALGDRRIGLPFRSYQTTRRRFLNRSLTAFAATIGTGFGASMLAFLWPKRRRGSFGSKIDLGDVNDLVARTRTPGGGVTPIAVPAAQAYVVPVNENISGSQFDGDGLVEGGLMVLWHRCVHLGCRVPYCAESRGFECPCHGSKYNLFGEYEDGPAPRNLDRFIVSIDDNNRLIAHTGQVIETPRARTKTVPYPQGPSCI